MKMGIVSPETFYGMSNGFFNTVANFVVVVYFVLSRLLYLALSANLGLLCMPHPGKGHLV